MILGVSHLALRSADFDRDRSELESQGWSTDFIDHEVHIHSCERPFLSAGHPDKQSLALLRHLGMPALELVSPVATDSPIEHFSRLDLAELHGASGVIRVPDLARTVEFFVNGLGFREYGGKGLHSREIALRRPLPQWSMNLTIEEFHGSDRIPRFDDKGWFVLALLSSDAQADAAAATVVYDAVTMTEPFVIRVNGREWKVVLCVLPNGFGIELIEIARSV